jgi:hypothetical protein
MRIHKLYIVLGLMIAIGFFLELAAHADESNQLTKITFSAPVQIPGQVLPAGTYTFLRANDDDLDLIQIFNADRTLLLATMQTVPTEAREPADDITVTLAEQQSGNPPLLVKWFYPGRMTGHEFVYPKEQAHEIAQARQETFVGSKLVSNEQAAGE